MAEEAPPDKKENAEIQENPEKREAMESQGASENPEASSAELNSGDGPRGPLGPGAEDMPETFETKVASAESLSGEAPLEGDAPEADLAPGENLGPSSEGIDVSTLDLSDNVLGAQNVIPSPRTQRRTASFVFGISIILLLVAILVTYLISSRDRSKLTPGKDYYAILQEEDEGYELSLDAVGRPLALLAPGAMRPAGFLPRESVETPIGKIAVATGQFDGGLMATLGMENLIIGTSVPEDQWRTPSILSLFHSGQIKYLGLESSMDYERLVALGPDLTFAPTMKSVAVFDELNIPSVKTYTDMDNGLETRFVFVNWLAAFGDKEETAILWRKNVDARLDELRKSVKGLPKAKTLWAVICDKRVFVEPGNNWVGELIAMMGGTYLFKDVGGDSTIEVSLEKFIDAGKDADVMFMYPGLMQDAASKEDIIRYNENLSSFKPLSPEGRVYMTENLFYESFGRLDEIAEELAAILHPEAFPGHELKFFKEIT
jgi:iron complex transport system substrate-binding protein